MKLTYSYLKENFPLKGLLVISLCLSAILCTGCHQGKGGPYQITSINIIDRNGMTETISEKSRLAGFQKTDFLADQPYQKVLRVYGRQENGDVRSCITSYHPNGGIKQYLEAVNNRAFGRYLEWYPNGAKKIESTVIGGVADINTEGEKSWLFDGVNRAYNDSGLLVAEIPYVKGELEGECRYYHENGKVWKLSPHTKNVLHGTQKTFLADGTLFLTTEYREGVKEGASFRYWAQEKVACEEVYEKGLLMEGRYFDQEREKAAEIVSGNGFRALFGKERIQELQEFRGGKAEGVVKIFDEKGRLLSTFFLKNGEKEGEEVSYYLSGEPKLAMTWQRGMLQGTVKTWYENGALETQKELGNNVKNGLFTSWFRNGNLMFVEEYDNDKLVKGEYYRSGEKMPLSKIEKGKGMATLFDADGNFSRKILYQEGRPLE